jgi:hypothetical protein
MNDLDPRSRAIVEAARDADDPSPADRNRIRRAVMVQLAVGAAASSAAAGTMSVGMKLGLAALAVSLVGGGAVGLVHWQQPQSRANVAEHTRASVASARDPAASPVAIPKMAPSPAIAPLTAESHERRPDRPRKPAGSLAEEKASFTQEDQLNAEVAVLKRAREELRLGRPVQTLEALREYDLRFGKGTLDQERQAMAALAACQAHPGPGSRAQAEAFLRSSPKSPMVGRVRVACITPARGDSH